MPGTEAGGAGNGREGKKQEEEEEGEKAGRGGEATAQYGGEGKGIGKGCETPR